MTDKIIYYIYVTQVLIYPDSRSYHSFVLQYYFRDVSSARALARSLAGGTLARSSHEDWFESQIEQKYGLEHYTIYKVKQLKAWEDGMAALVL